MKEKIKCTEVYDSIIIGGGPAGITSAIYLARRKLCVLLIYEVLGGQASITADIENYSGFKFVSGIDFTKKLNEHLNDYDISCKTERVVSIDKSENNFEIKTSKGKYLGKTLIIASGARQRKLGIKGEEKYLNKGVAYCATCDAPLYQNKDVAIIGGGNSAMEAAIQLEKYATNIYLIVRDKKLKGEQILIDKVNSFKNLKIFYNSESKEVKGEKFVEELIFEKKEKLESIKVKGVFIEIGYLPNSELFDIEKNDYGEIKIDNMNKTSIKGIFAAGDVTEVPIKQIIVSAGEGAKAAISAAEYLSRSE